MTDLEPSERSKTGTHSKSLENRNYFGEKRLLIFQLRHSALCVRDLPRRYEGRQTRCQTPAVLTVRDVAVPAASVAVTAASVVPLALAVTLAATVVAVTAASAVPRVTVASLAVPPVAVTAASEEKQLMHTTGHRG
ncbi:uncharacterized protein LOC144907428 [Branchiostoma floridae x Branchiostoma belcheri]